MLVQICTFSTHFPLTSKLLDDYYLAVTRLFAVSSEEKNFEDKIRLQGIAFWGEGKICFQKYFPNPTPLKPIWCLKGKRGLFTRLMSWWTTELHKVSLGIIAVLQMRKLELRGFKEFIKSLHNASWGWDLNPGPPYCKPMPFSTTAGSIPIFRRMTSSWKIY